ncbi:MAG: hypothetical protein Q7R47_02280, partial [Candidatus Diapherotrites archaeon]|nr:hypothetical protein [Candidatus Diapherotrites archaeon]
PSSGVAINKAATNTSNGKVLELQAAPFSSQKFITITAPQTIAVPEIPSALGLLVAVVVMLAMIVPRADHGQR